MRNLTSSERKILSAFAQTVKPLIQIGQNGATPEVAAQLNSVLRTHEVVKVKFNEFKEDKIALAQHLATSTSSALVRIIGNTAIFFRPAEKKEERQFDIVF